MSVAFKKRAHPTGGWWKNGISAGLVGAGVDEVTHQIEVTQPHSLVQRGAAGQAVYVEAEFDEEVHSVATANSNGAGDEVWMAHDLTGGSWIRFSSSEASPSGAKALHPSVTNSCRARLAEPKAPTQTRRILSWHCT